jgi:lipopolysaccharide transport system permease protein
VFVLAGLIPWTFFSQAVTQGSQSLINQQHLLTKVYFPRLFVPTAAVMGCFVDFIIGLLMYGVVLACYRIAPPVSILFLPGLVLLTAGTTLGVVYFLSALTVAYRDFRYVVPIAVQVLMYATPIVYPLELFPRKYQWIVALNPVAGIIDGYRSAILGKPWDLSVIGASILATVVFFAAGMLYFRKTEQRFADIA